MRFSISSGKIRASGKHDGGKVSARVTVLGAVLLMALATLPPDERETIDPVEEFELAQIDKGAAKGKKGGNVAKSAKIAKDASDDVDEDGKKRKCPPGETATPVRGRGGGGPGCM